MNTLTAECVATRPNPFWLKPLFIFLLVFGGILLFLSSALPILWILTIIDGVLIFFIYKRKDIEFEYLYFDGELTVDKIAAQTIRKHVKTFYSTKIEIIAPADSAYLSRYAHRNGRVCDYSGLPTTKGGKQFVMYYNHSDKVLLTLSSEMVSTLKTALRDKVYLEDSQNY